MRGWTFHCARVIKHLLAIERSRGTTDKALSRWAVRCGGSGSTRDTSRSLGLPASSMR